MKKLFTLSLLAVATLTGANAADFPIKDKPVTIVVPFTAGGPTDRVARDLAEALRKPLGANVVVENVAGAGGTIGANKVAKAPQDGHTVLLHHIGMATSPALYRKMPYNTTEDFEYLGMVNDVPMTLIGRPTLPANNYKELAVWIEQNKGKVNLGNAGLGAASHLCGLLFQSAIKTDMTTVPYKGTAPAMNDLAAGGIEMVTCSLPEARALIDAGKARPLAVMASQPSALFPAAPTLKAATGSNWSIGAWRGIAAPKGLPADIQAKLGAAIKKIYDGQEFQGFMQQRGFGTIYADSKGFEQFMAKGDADMGTVMKSLGLAK